MGISKITLNENVLTSNSSLNDLTLVIGVCITDQKSNTGPTLVRSRKELSELPGYSIDHLEWRLAYYLIEDSSLVVVTSTSNKDDLSNQVRKLYSYDGCEIEVYTDLGNSNVASKLIDVSGVDGWIREGDIQIKPPTLLALSYYDGLSSNSSQVAVYEGSVNTLIANKLTEVPSSTAYCKCLVNSNLKGDLYRSIKSLLSPVYNVTSTNSPYTKSERLRNYRNHKSNCIYLNYHHGLYLIDSDRTCADEGLNRESWRRLANKINRDIFYMSESFIGRQADTLLLEEITSSVSSYLSEYESKSLIASFEVQCNTDNNTETDLANGKINLHVTVKLDPICDEVTINTTYNLNYE